MIPAISHTSFTDFKLFIYETHFKTVPCGTVNAWKLKLFQTLRYREERKRGSLPAQYFPTGGMTLSGSGQLYFPPFLFSVSSFASLIFSEFGTTEPVNADSRSLAQAVAAVTG